MCIRDSDVKCSRHLARVIEEHGGRPLMWRTGHSLVKAKMKETGAPLAGEMSGHIFYKDRWYGFDDGLYAGARLLDVAVNWGYYAENVSRIYDTGFRGFALYGGLIVALTAGALLARAFHLPLWDLADGTVPAFATGIVLMRTGCFLSGCCFGTVTSLPWGVTYPPGSPAWAHHLLTGEISLLQMDVRSRPVHPTQLYEMIAALAFCGLAIWLSTRRGRGGMGTVPAGVPFLVFALGFTLFRLADHFLRVRLATLSAPLWFYPLLYSLIVAGVAGLIFWRLRFGRTAAPSSKGEADLDTR